MKPRIILIVSVLSIAARAAAECKPCTASTADKPGCENSGTLCGRNGGTCVDAYTVTPYTASVKVQVCLSRPALWSASTCTATVGAQYGVTANCLNTTNRKCAYKQYGQYAGQIIYLEGSLADTPVNTIMCVTGDSCTPG